MQTDVQDLRDPRGGDLADCLDWQELLCLDPAILVTKHGRLQMTYDMRHHDTGQMSASMRGWYLSRLDEIYKVLDEHWGLEADWWHEPTSVYPESDWQAVEAHPTDRLVDSLRRWSVEDKPLHTSQLKTTLIWEPPPTTRTLLQNVLLTRHGLASIAGELRNDVEAFHDGQERFQSYLHGHVDHLQPLGAGALCTYLHRSVSWDDYPVECPDPCYDLDWQLSSALWEPGRPPVLGGRLIQPLTIKSWNAHVGTLVPEALSLLPFQLRYHVRWLPKSLSMADKFLTNVEKGWRTLYESFGKLVKASAGGKLDEKVVGRDDQDTAINAGQGIIDLRRAVRRGEEVVGQLSPTILCWSETEVDADEPDTLRQAKAEVKERVKAIQEQLFRQGLVVRVETANASIQWLASLPGHVNYGMRGRVLSTKVLTAIVPHHHQWQGPAWNHRLNGPPLMQVSSDGAPFNLVTHIGDLGNILIAGPSRRGKSALLGLMARQTKRYARSRCCLFDRDCSLKAVTLLSGGQHYSFAPGSPLRLQPLRNLETPDERATRVRWVEDLLIGEGLTPDPDERGAIVAMIEMMAERVPMQRRTLSWARKLLQVKRLKIGFEPYCDDGIYNFLDGDNDSVGWDTRLLCFEMSGLLKHERALNATMGYCNQELETHWFTGDPVFIAMDELKWLLDQPRIQNDFEFWLLGRAKKNVSLWGSLQELSHLKTTRLWIPMINNMPTKILLPNHEALLESVRPLYEEMGVSERSLQRLAAAQPYQDYLYVSELGQRLFQCRMHPVERLLCAASSPEELTVLDEMAQQYSPEELPAAWLRRWGYPEFAQYVEPVHEKEEVCGDAKPSSVWPLPRSLVEPLALVGRS